MIDLSLLAYNITLPMSMWRPRYFTESEAMVESYIFNGTLLYGPSEIGRFSDIELKKNSR